MAQPRPDRVDVDARTEQMHRSGVPDCVRADTLGSEGRCPDGGSLREPFHQGVDTETCDRLAPHIEKDPLVG